MASLFPIPPATSHLTYQDGRNHANRVVARESVIARSRQWEFTVEVSFTVEVALDGT